jgi:hypothetical protein
MLGLAARNKFTTKRPRAQVQMQHDMRAHVNGTLRVDQDGTVTYFAFRHSRFEHAASTHNCDTTKDITCTDCPTNSYSSAASTLRSHCTCNGGYYGSLGSSGTCIRCPDNSNSVAGSTLIISQCICKLRRPQHQNRRRILGSHKSGRKERLNYRANTHTVRSTWS